MSKSSNIKQVDNFMIITDSILGKGSTGCVYEGYEIETKKKVAVKIVEKWTLKSKVAEYLLDMEKTALMNVDNKYLLQGIKIVEDEKNVYLITKFCNGGTLKTKIINSPSGYLSEEKALKIFFCLLRGCKRLADEGILHRDLKPANIMFDENFPKIIDYGYCTIDGFAKPIQKYNVGSPSYMAPESHYNNKYSQKTEIWALGIILFQMLTGRTLDAGRRMSDIYFQLETRGVPYPSHISHYPRKIINWCLKADPKNRPTCWQLIETCFPKLNKSKNVENKSYQFVSLKRIGSQKRSQEIFSKQNNKEEKVIKNNSNHFDHSIDLNKIVEMLSSKKQKQQKQRKAFQAAYKNNIEQYQNFQKQISIETKGYFPRKKDTKGENKNQLKFLRMKQPEQKVNWDYEEMAKTKRQMANEIRDIDDCIWKSNFQNSNQQKRNRFISNKLIPSSLMSPKKNSNVYKMIFEEDESEKPRCKTQRADFSRA